MAARAPTRSLMSPPKNSAPALVWFRDDLRLEDNPALHAAWASQAPLLLFYVLEDGDGLRPYGGASKWWLHHALQSLQNDIEKRGGHLTLLRGRSSELVPALAGATGASGVFWNRRYGGAEIALDGAIKKALTGAGREAASFNGALLHEPWEIKSKTGGSYGVYSPYWRASLEMGIQTHTLPAPDSLTCAPWPGDFARPIGLKDLALLPSRPDWAGGLRAAWTPGEDGARALLRSFVEKGAPGYAARRDMLAIDGTSRLSPYLRFGEISPRQAAAAVQHAAIADPGAKAGVQKFIAELGWREFNYHVLYHHPDVAWQNLQRAFDKMPWRDLPAHELDAWKQGRTGYPVVDAGMRELWQTGTMHNRARMITASFLIKHLLCDWRIGEAWFWDCLCDADPANNSMNWQWVAGTGTDASPFFRIFNPMIQGAKFDPDGDYVRRYVPELAGLPATAIHSPWTAPPTVLKAAGVILGKSYPHPMVDHIEARDRALAIYENIKAAKC